MSKKASATAPRVYSYIRFSTPEQRLGDSLRRQMAEAERYAKQRGLTLDTSLRMIDEGVGSHDGTNVKRGALGQFLSKVKAGEVPRGSTLIVENIDRLGRQGFIDAFAVISDIVRAGIVITTLSPFAEYTAETIHGGLVWQLVGQMQRAYEESRQKSIRIRASRESARQKARDGGRVLTKQVPAWVRVTENGELVAIPDAAKVVRQIFKWKVQGLGVRMIEAKLNEGDWWTPPAVTKAPNAKKRRGGNGWRASYIRKILTNRAVIGEYQPYRFTAGKNSKREPVGEPISDYFPKVVEKQAFYAVQRVLDRNRGKGGQTGKFRNVLRDLVKCAYCGSAMHYDSKNPAEGEIYLLCESAKRKAGCTRHRIRYLECETTLLENCRRLRPEDVLPNPKDQEAECDRLKEQLNGIEGELASINTELGNLTKHLAKAPSEAVADQLLNHMEERTRQRQQLKDDRIACERKLANAAAANQSLDRWKHDFEELAKAIKADKPEVRIRLNRHLHELIERIEVFPVGFKKLPDADAPLPPRPPTREPKKGSLRYSDAKAVARMWPNDVEGLAEGIADEDPKLFRTPEGREFLDWVTARRMSPEGRFLRIYFKTGSLVDIIPPGSIATGMRLVKTKRGQAWESVSPSTASLWEEFVASKRKRRRRG